MLALWEPYGNFLHCLFTLPWSTCLLTSRLMHTGKAGLPSTTSSTSCYGFAPQACLLCLQPCGQWTGPTVSSLRSEWVNEYETENTTVQSTGSGTRTSVTAVLLCVQWIKVYLCSQVSVCFSRQIWWCFHPAAKQILFEHLKYYWKLKLGLWIVRGQYVFRLLYLSVWYFGSNIAKLKFFHAKVTSVLQSGAAQ